MWLYVILLDFMWFYVFLCNFSEESQPTDNHNQFESLLQVLILIRNFFWSLIIKDGNIVDHTTLSLLNGVLIKFRKSVKFS